MIRTLHSPPPQVVLLRRDPQQGKQRGRRRRRLQLAPRARAARGDGDDGGNDGADLGRRLPQHRPLAHVSQTGQTKPQELTES